MDILCKTPIKTRFKRTFQVSIIAIMIIFSASSVRAYDNDTHFWLTYYLARKTGYTHLQATQIASATISVDFDNDTEPITPAALSMQNVRATLHALPKVSEVNKECRSGKKLDLREEADFEKSEEGQKCLDAIVLRRQEEFWNKVKEEKSNPGVFLHYLQDKHAHRGFRSIWGHGGYLRVDFLDSNREKAKEMARDTIYYLKEFMKVFAPEKTLPAEVDWVEIDHTMEQLFKANPSSGIEPSQLLIFVRDTKISNLKKLLQAAQDKGFQAFVIRPDSSKARDIIKQALNLNYCELPEIWLYDLRTSGNPRKNTTSINAVYKQKNSDENPFDRPLMNENQNLEKDDEDKETKKKEGKRLFLPWHIVNHDIAEIPLCTS